MIYRTKGGRAATESWHLYDLSYKRRSGGGGILDFVRFIVQKAVGWRRDLGICMIYHTKSGRAAMESWNLYDLSYKLRSCGNEILAFV
jgi:hypothetical protein